MLFDPLSHGDGAPLAVLSSFSGLMHIYSEVAFKLFLNAEIELKKSQMLLAGVPSGSMPSSATDLPLMTAVEQHCRIPELLDGFTLPQWAEHAK
jgi:hypothetical protein